MDKQLREKRALQQDLRTAIAHDELTLHYQPQAHIDGEITGFEALVRWHHPRHGLVPPEHLHSARRGKRPDRRARRMDPAHGLPRGRVLAAAAAASPSICRRCNSSMATCRRLVHQILLETGLSPARLELEITEGVLIGDFTRAVVDPAPAEELWACASPWTISAPAIRRCPILQSFPFDKIKIDQAFVANLGHSQQAATIIRAVIALGRGLILPVVAEGVETEEQLQFLAGEHCDEIQGYLSAGRSRSKIMPSGRPRADFPDVSQTDVRRGWIVQGRPGGRSRFLLTKVLSAIVRAFVWRQKCDYLESRQQMSEQDRARDLFFGGLACLEKRDFQNAEMAFLETLKLAPRSVPTLNNLAIAQYEQGRVADAAMTATRVVEIDPRSIDAYLMLSTCQKDQQRYDDVLKSCQTLIAIEPNIAEAHCNLGYALNKAGRYQDAIASFDRAIALRAQFADAHLNRGNAFNSLKRFDEVYAAYDQALAINPNLAEAWLGRGNTLSGLKRWDEAFAAYDKALALRPELEAAWIGRGNAYSDIKKHDEAVSAYDKALALNPDLEGAWLGRGNVFSHLKRYDEALAAYDRALALKPISDGAWVGRGNVFSELKRYKAAFAAYDKALALKPNLPDAWLGRGNAFVDLKRYDDALGSYDKALDIEPDLAEAHLGPRLCLCRSQTLRRGAQGLRQSADSQA